MVVIIMGVSGCGKTTLGAALAAAQAWRFLDADDFHSAANKARMQAGIPLQDADRADWLQRLGKTLADYRQQGESVVLACSALKQAYRDQLAAAAPYRLIYLEGSRALLAARLASRQGHFMSASLLDSQLATLEAPVNALNIPIDLPINEALARIAADLAVQG